MRRSSRIVHALKSMFLFGSVGRLGFCPLRRGSTSRLQSRPRHRNLHRDSKAAAVSAHSATYSINQPSPMPLAARSFATVKRSLSQDTPLTRGTMRADRIRGPRSKSLSQQPTNLEYRTVRSGQNSLAGCRNDRRRRSCEAELNECNKVQSTRRSAASTTI